MKRRLIGVVLAALALMSCSLYSQSAEFYPLNLVKPGQKGYGKTVFEGTAVDTFDVEILGVLKNFGPKQSLILARLSGDRLRETGVFVGMSGSPVYLDDKLVGAVALTFAFAKEPIAGITPIKEIVDIFQEKPQRTIRISQNRNPGKIYQLAEFRLADLLPNNTALQFESNSPPSAISDETLKPIATPLNLGGFSPQSIQYFAPHLRTLGLVPVRGFASAKIDQYKDAPLEEGSTISVQLVRGDMDVSASGTVTHISGNKIYAFGHPFLGIGYTDMPLNKAAVLTIVPGLRTSQKISATTQMIGSIKQDRATGILGIKGETPKLVPVQLKLLTSRNELKEFHYEVVTDNLLTPFLINLTVHNSIVSSERAIGGQTLQVKCTISVKGQPDVNFENSVTDLANSSIFAAAAASSPVDFLLNSGFEDVVMEKIDLEITAVEQTRKATLERVWQDKLEVQPGEDLELTIFLRKTDGELLVERHPVTIPEDIRLGPLQILVADGLSLVKLDADEDLKEYVPENLHQLIRAINNLKKNDRLYIRLYRAEAGAMVGGEGLPDLPPSLLALYNSEKTSGGVKSIDKVIYLEYELPPANFVLHGQKVIKVKVKS